jgi:hypothetical protein
VVLVIERMGDEAPLVTVPPIRRRAPRDPTSAVEIPARVKRHLGLDHEPFSRPFANIFKSRSELVAPRA